MKKRRTKPTVHALRKDIERLLISIDSQDEHQLQKDRNRIDGYKRRNPSAILVEQGREITFDQYLEMQNWINENVAASYKFVLTPWPCGYVVAFDDPTDAIFFKMRFGI